MTVSNNYYLLDGNADMLVVLVKSELILDWHGECCSV